MLDREQGQKVKSMIMVMKDSHAGVVQPVSCVAPETACVYR